MSTSSKEKTLSKKAEPHNQQSPEFGHKKCKAKSRASDISRKKKKNFAGFSGANSRKNWPISRDFRGKKVKIRGKIGRFCGIFAGEKSKFAEKSADFAGF